MRKCRFVSLIVVTMFSSESSVSGDLPIVAQAVTLDSHFDAFDEIREVDGVWSPQAVALEHGEISFDYYNFGGGDGALCGLELDFDVRGCEPDSLVLYAYIAKGGSERSPAFGAGFNRDPSLPCLGPLVRQNLSAYRESPPGEVIGWYEWSRFPDILPSNGILQMVIVLWNVRIDAVELECSRPIPGDWDDDDDVDLSDFLMFSLCFGYEDIEPFSPFCDPSDFDQDGDADLADLISFQAAFTGAK